MKQHKKFLIILATIVLMVVAIRYMAASIKKQEFNASIGENHQGDNVGYYYGTLNANPEAKGIYNAMKAMYSGGLFKTGGGIDLVEAGSLSQDQIERYINGSEIIDNAFNLAKKAFELDYPEAFYIDYSKLSIQFTQDSTNKYHAHIGAGNNANYFIEGITASNVNEKIAEYEAKAEEVVQALNAEGNKTEYVYNNIVQNGSYKLENDASAGNEGFVRTAYGALIKKEAASIGYSKALKSILDRANIECVIGNPSDIDTQNLTVSTYVRIDGKWHIINDLGTEIPSIPGIALSNASYLKKYENPWRTFTKPELLDNIGISVSNWMTENGTQVSDKIKSRIALIANETSQTQAMDNAVLIASGGDIIAKRTYNLRLVAGKDNITSTSENIKVAIPYINGFDMNRQGFIYEAYEYVGNTANKIPCYRTPYGLVVLCNKSGNITIIAKTYSTIDTNNTLVLTSSQGGTVVGDNKDICLVSGSKTITVTPNSGYEIEKVIIAGREMPVSSANAASSFSVSYSDIEEFGNNLVFASFISTSADMPAGEIKANLTPTSARITISETNMVKEVGENINIAPNIITNNGSQKYEWYKNNEKLVGQNSDRLTLNGLKIEDAGQYRLVIVTTLGAKSVKAEGPQVTLVVNQTSIEPTPEETPNPNETPDPNPNPGEEFLGKASATLYLDVPKTEFYPNEEFTVTLKATNIVAGSAGLTSIKANFYLENGIFELVEMVMLNGWEIENSENGRYNFVNHRAAFTEGEDAILEIRLRANSGVVGTAIVGFNDTFVASSGSMPNSSSKALKNLRVVDPNAPGETTPTQDPNQGNNGNQGGTYPGVSGGNSGTTATPKPEKKKPSTSGTSFPSSGGTNSSSGTTVEGNTNQDNTNSNTNTNTNTNTQVSGNTNQGYSTNVEQNKEAEAAKPKKKGNIFILIICIAVVAGSLVFGKKILDEKKNNE